MASFLYSVSYRAHCGAIMAVFVSGLSMAQDRGRHTAVMHRKTTSKHKLSITEFTMSVCVKILCCGCKDCYHSCPALHCRTGPVAPRGNSPLAEGHQVLWVLHHCFPGLYLCFPTCSLLQAQSYVTVRHSRHYSWQFFQKVKIWHCRVAPFCGYRYLQNCLKV